MSWEQAEREALARMKSTETLLAALELRHPIWPDHLRIVNHDAAVDLTLEALAPVDAGQIIQFAARAFDFDEPKNDTEPDPTLTVNIDGTTGTLKGLLRTAIAHGTPVECTLRTFMHDVQTNTPARMLKVIHLQLRSAATTSPRISAVFGYTNPANQAFPSDNYTIDEYPGLAT